MNLIYLFSISLLTELTSILFETPPEKGQKATSMQEATDSEKGWKYGAGIELVF